MCHRHGDWSEPLSRRMECAADTGRSVSLSRSIERVTVTEGGMCHCHGEWSVLLSQGVECVTVTEGGVCHLTECGVCYCHGGWSVLLLR